MEFEKVSDDLGLDKVNTSAAREHVGEIECRIIVIKEWAINVITNLPFVSIHKQVVIHLIYFLVLWLNYFMATQVISEKHSPR